MEQVGKTGRQFDPDLVLDRFTPFLTEQSVNKI